MKIQLSELAKAAEKTKRLSETANKLVVSGVQAYSPPAKFAPSVRAPSASLAQFKDVPYGIKG